MVCFCTYRGVIPRLFHGAQPFFHPVAIARIVERGWPVIQSQPWPRRPKSPVYRSSEEYVLSFVQSLTADEKQVFDATTIADGLLKALGEIQDAEREHKGSSVSRRAAEAILPFIAGLEQYGKALDIFANSSDMLCPIWGSLRVLLQVRFPQLRALNSARTCPGVNYISWVPLTLLLVTSELLDWKRIRRVF